MSFVLEVKKSGKDTILYNNGKYRESYELKNGDIVWRCLGKTCKASIKTNKEKTIIYNANETHSGPHPVTMRALTPTPPPPRLSSRPATPVAESGPHSSASTSTPSTVPSSPTQLTEESVSCPPPVSLTPSELQAENVVLREKLERLRVESQAVLDHSIESDQRLLQYTDTIFLHPPSQSVSPTKVPITMSSFDLNEIQQKEHEVLQQFCQLDDSIKTALRRIKELESEIAALRRPCEQCRILREESRNMIEGLRCLEAENKYLKNKDSSPSLASTSPLTTTTQPVLELQNRFEMLGSSSEDSQALCEEVGFTEVRKRQRRSKPKNKAKKRKSNSDEKRQNGVLDERVTLPFSSVSVLGDSHVRGLAALLRRQVRKGPHITGVCKPNAGLLDMLPASKPPGDHCYVLMAGTNDVDTGREDTIFRHLEGILKTCKKSSRILAVSLPSRHDLDVNSPSYLTVQLVNSYMNELCQRHEGVEMLDISCMARRHFTPHGLHLRHSGKSLLARLISEKLALMTPALELDDTPATPPSPQRPDTRPHHDTYAAAVISGDRTPTARPEPPRTRSVEPPSSPDNDVVFLDKPISVAEQN